MLIRILALLFIFYPSISLGIYEYNDSFFLKSVAIGSNTAIDTKSVLDVRSTTKGALLPRMTTAQRNAITSVPAGLLVYDTDLQDFFYFNNTSWFSLGAISSIKVADSANTPNTIVLRNGSGNFVAEVIQATTFTGALTGNASTATALAANPADCTAGQYAVSINASGTLGCTQVTGDQVVAQATYTPTLTNTTNVAASTAFVTGYYRIGNDVTVFGNINVDVTAASTATEVQITLPVSSNLVNGYDLAGTCGSSGVTTNGYCSIIGDPATERARMRFYDDQAANNGKTFHFSYQILP